MSATLVILVMGGYFGLLSAVAWFSSRGATASTFFVANHRAPWLLVAYGMIGVSISGITFISVPGQVLNNAFSYFQMVLGYAAGLLVVAFLLLPVFYKMGKVSIYEYLKQRFGRAAQLTGATFFLVAQTLIAAFKLYLMGHVLHLVLFGPLGLPFWLTVLVTLLLIWLYTYRGGIKTVIFTDTLQTTFLLASVVISIFIISQNLNLSFGEMYTGIRETGTHQIFYWDWKSPNNFFKLFFTGLLVTAMTNGLDQSIMQKHLTCKSQWAAQKNLIVLAVVLLFVNLLFLFLGGSLNLYATQMNVPSPAETDNLYPVLAFEYLGPTAAVFFLLGIAAAAYSSADSSLTGLTTSFCVDFLEQSEEEEKPYVRYLVHLGFTLLVFLVIIIFRQIKSESVLASFIRVTGFVYGPLVGLYAFGLLSRRRVPARWIPWLCVAAPLISLVIDYYLPHLFPGFQLGYAIMVVNCLLAYGGLYLISSQETNPVKNTIPQTESTA